MKEIKFLPSTPKAVKQLLLPLLLFFVNPARAQENIALNKPVSVNSVNEKYPAKNATDGKITRGSKWMSGQAQAPHILEINLEKYYRINSITVYTGIPKKERTPQEATQAAGFWSAKNFRLQYWDDANWSDIPKAEVHENRLTEVPFKFDQPVSTYKIRLVCDDGEPISIMEITAAGTEVKGMKPPTDETGIAIKQPENKMPKTASVTVSKKVTGKTMKYVGYNQGYYFPNSNASGWMEYANVNSVRLWTSLEWYAPVSAVEVDPSLKTMQEFDRRKEALRQSPEKNAFLKWDTLNKRYASFETGSTNGMVFDYALMELKRLRIDPLLQLNYRDFDSTWTRKWQNWQRVYSLVYHAAKTGNVEMYAMFNEPNHKNAGPIKIADWISGIQIFSDAIYCAIADVNKKYGKKLTAKMVAPVTAGNNTDWWAAAVKAIRTDYHGKTTDRDQFSIFSTHSYNSPAAGYSSRVANIREVITENHPAKTALPIVFTEIGRWMNAYLIDKEETMDSPSLFTEWAGIYTQNMKNQAYGMWAFKFSNTTQPTYPRGVKSGHHFTWQGTRIVEDAYHNLAKGKPVKVNSNTASAQKITDEIKTDASAWISDSTSAEKWVEIDLQKQQKLGSAVVYTGSDGGVYTAPDRVQDFKLQYEHNGQWHDIAGTVEKANKYAQVFALFKTPVTTQKIRFVSADAGRVKVREIKVYAADDGPDTSKTDYNVSGIQRTGEVLRLFAKGFKDERNLFETKTPTDDTGLDAATSFDPKTGNYYIWLVQRGGFEYTLNLDLSALNIPAGNPVVAETVSGSLYGEAMLFSAQKNLQVKLPPQSVMLLTIPSAAAKTKTTIKASSTATVFTGKKTAELEKLSVALNAAEPVKNAVTYINFKAPKILSAKTATLDVSGKSSDGKTFRFHVYAIPGAKWDKKTFSWGNAPLLDKKEALIMAVGQKASIAGELTVDGKERVHHLDVTGLLRSHPAQNFTFVLVRETRQIGDDEDKGRAAMLSGKNLNTLTIWAGKN